MGVKNKIRIILLVLLLVLVCSAIFFIFKIEILNEKSENNDEILTADNTILPTPDRIIYKNQNNEYIIINSGTSAYTQIYSELYNRTTNTIEGKVYSEDEISQMQNKGSFIEFDYNSKSKNYVFMLEEKEIGIIRRFSDSGQVIKTSLSDVNDLIKSIDKLTKNMTRYDFNKEYNYTSDNKLAEIPKDIESSQVQQGVYQKIIQYNENDYQNLLNELNFKTNKEMINIDFDKQTVIVTLSQYKIKNIKQNIGNVKYEFGEFLNEYIVNLLVVSKVVNTNCIYYNTEYLSDYTTINNYANTNENKDDYAVEYYIENSKYYAIVDHKAIEIISLEKACDIADLEAKKEKYQYQSWKSEFYTRGKNKDGDISAELISDLSDISKLYHWNEEWKNGEYKGTLMWKIRLFDDNDPLTSLYIYIDAINGNVIGAGDSSD